MNNEWRDNPHWEYRKIPEEAKQYDNVDVIGENGIASYEQNQVICFCGPSIILKWKPSASNFQTDLDL